MSKFSDNYQKFLKNYHEHSPEFHQAVKEVYEDVEILFERYKKYNDFNVLERLLEPDRIIRFRVCWEDDNQSIQVNRGWRVQYNNALGVYKGGLRFHDSVNESILKFLAFEQCFKNALTELPMGGAKGGSDFNPKDKSESEVRRFCYAFMEELYRHIGSSIDVPAGDINVGDREIGYLFGHYLKITNRWEGAITGKSPNFGGSCGRAEATGYGLIYLIKEALEAHDQNLENKKVSISGSGNVAIYAAEKCLQEKAKVLCVSDSDGVLYFEDGLTTEQLNEIKKIKFQNRGRLSDAEFGDYSDKKSPWDFEADLALPCATQNEIKSDEAEKILKNKTILIAEGANMPVTSKAQKIFSESQIIYIPGKAANAGGVAVSGLERTQNSSSYPWSLERVNEELKNIMKRIHKNCLKYVEKENGRYSYKKGANLYGFKRVADALIAYGLK